MIEVFRYHTDDGKEPVTEWLLSLRDKQAQAKVRLRLKRLEVGIFGDCESVGEGVLNCGNTLAPVIESTSAVMGRLS
jgi:putative addiction module killer protein